MTRRRFIAVSVVLGSCVGALTLSTTEQKSVVISGAGSSGSSYDFGTVQLGTPVKTNPNPYFTISPLTAADDDCVTVNLSATCGSDFALLGLPTPARVWCQPNQGSGNGSATLIVPGNGLPGTVGTYGLCTDVTYQFGATFTPHITAAQSCEVDIGVTPSVGGMCGAGSGSNAMMLTVLLTGSGAGSGITVSKANLDFGDVNTTSESNPQTVQVTNIGASQVTVDIADSNSTVFPYTPAITQKVLPANGSILMSVSCNEPILGANSATLTFTPENGSPAKVVTLTCNGIVTTVSETPNPIDFGGLLVGHAPVSVPVMITTTSGTPVILSSFAFESPSPDISWQNGTAPTGATITNAMPYTVTVDYSAMTPDDSNDLGTMTFVADSTTIHVPITGTLEQGGIGMNPARVDFGPICIGSNATQLVNVYANAEGTVTLSAPSGPAAPFSVTMSPAAPTDTSQNVILTTKVAPPLGGATGVMTGMVTVNTDIPGMSTYNVSLQASVVPAGVASTPDDLNFGTAPVGTPTSGKDIVISNCSSDDLMLQSVSITGTTPGEFDIVTEPNTFPVALPKAQSQSFTLQMFPRTLGMKSATFTVDYGTGSATATLEGVAVNGNVSTSDRQTYYACSTGRGTAAWPIGLALLALRRRRR